MNLYQNIGEFTPDSLIASGETAILKEGIGLKAGQGVLKRGSLICKGDDKAGYLAGKAVDGVEMKVYGILTDDTDTGSEAAGDNIPVVCYLTGVFNRGAVTVAEGATIDTFETDMRNAGMFLRAVQEY